MGGAMCGCGGFAAGPCAPALWTWGSIMQSSSRTWPLGRPRMAARCEYCPCPLTSPSCSVWPFGPHLLPLRAATFAAVVVTSWRSTTSAWLCSGLAISCPRRLPIAPSHRSRPSAWVGSPCCGGGAALMLLLTLPALQAPASPSAALVSPRLSVRWARRTATCASGLWTSPLCSWRQVGQDSSSPSGSSPGLDGSQGSEKLHPDPGTHHC